ncbi:hypothetical protein [Bacillus sp. Marseille-Q3570]
MTITLQEDNSNIIEAIVAKNRNGPLGTVELFFERETNLFKDILEGHV